MYYAKSYPTESIKQHTDNLLENLRVLKEIYGKEIEDIIRKNLKISEERFWILLEIICTYHDIGKIYTPFQNKIRASIGESIIQTSFSYEIVKHEQLSPMFVPVEKYNLSIDEKMLVYQAIYYHHERDNKEFDEEYIKEVIAKDILPQMEQVKRELGYELETNLNTKYIKYVKKRITEKDELYSEYCLLKGLLHRLDYSSSAEMTVEDETKENIRKYTEDSITNAGHHLNDLQGFCENNVEKSMVIIGSTGIGKTESALIWSNGAKTFFTLPIRISINAIYDRIEDNIGYKSVGLLHSTALEYLEEKDEFDNEEEKIAQTRNLFDKITVCTIDQLLPFVFKYKGYERILATLSYSKLVIDEIQAYSPNIVAIIIRGLEMINRMGGKFMVMTATLPRIYKEELEKRKIYFEFGKYIKPIERHKIKLQEKEIVEDLDIIIEKGKNSKVLVIVNTVNKAIELYLKLKEKSSEDIHLLHSKFIYKDRNEKERNIKEFSRNKQEKGIWITTQIVEASLDIDFDYLYTEMSTLDSLFQRLGRCFRSREYDKEEPNVLIYTKNVSGVNGKKGVYDEEIHKKSIELIQEYDGQILNEESKIELVDKLYSKELLEGTKFLKEFDDSMRILDNLIDYKVDKKTAQKLLRNIDNFIVIPKAVYEENLRLFEQYEEAGKNYKQKNKIKREIDKITVAITEGGRRKMQDRISRNPYCEDIWIIDAKYDDEVGLKLEKDEEYDVNEQFL